ncbi:unnamed protein product [Arctia plantaginis]|uniref:Uncharacterized protein n=1 Tax=Arctia plantaginis TaxID=874455 RepID=A0A8S0ZBZ0_ARCPL|nr:unnamed protein product [Arctia plantaginis]
MSLYEQQVEKRQEIARIKTNFNKDSASRKTVDYYKTRLGNLDSLWEEFKHNHDRMCTEESRTHQYFTEKWFESTEECYREVRALLWQSYQQMVAPLVAAYEEKSKLSSSSEQDAVKQQELDSKISRYSDGSSHSGSQNQHLTSTGTNSKYQDLQHQQQVNFKALTRTMENIVVDDIKEKWKFEDAIKSLQSRWDTIDKLHWEIEALSTSNPSYDALFVNDG